MPQLQTDTINDSFQKHKSKRKIYNYYNKTLNKNHQQQHNYQNNGYNTNNESQQRQRNNESRLSDIQSEISSVNNLIYSDLDSTLNTSKYSSFSTGCGNGHKNERRKLLKAILREDIDLLVSFIGD
jgi:hypothetical protein